MSIKVYDHDEEMPTFGDRYVAKVACKDADERGAWTVEGISVVIAQFSDDPLWYVIPTNPVHDESFKLGPGFDSPEQGAIYCSLMEES